MLEYFDEGAFSKAVELLKTPENRQAARTLGDNVQAF